MNERQMKKKKLLFIVEAMGGGIYTYILDLANKLVESYDLYIAYAIRPQTPVDYRKQFDNRIHLIEVKNFTRSINPMKDVKAFFEIRKIAREVSPDIINLHSSKAGVIGRWAFSGKKVPMYYTPHGYSFLMANYGWVKRTIFRIVETMSAKRNCTVISCSEGEHQETMKLTKNATYVNNGINTRELQKLINSVEVETKQPFTVFTLGRICYQKNPVLFNEVAEKLPDVRFLWIGDGELRKELKSPNIEVTGWVDRDEALRFSLPTDVFVLTSLWEGLPMSLLEAMYMKKLCVVSNVIGNRDVIHTGSNGYVCDSIEDFVKAIVEARSKDQSNQVNAAYNDVLQIYNTTSMAERYSGIYNRALKK